jgi:hypothetical protein
VALVVPDTRRSVVRLSPRSRRSYA